MANQHAARALPPGGRSSRGVFTRQLLLAAGWSSDAIESRVHAGRWQRLAAGVYLTHSGPITWEVRANAGLLHGGKSAVLWLDSAAYVDRMLSRPPATVHVLVPPGATGRHMPGVQFHRTRVNRATHGDPLRTMPWVTAIDRAAAADSSDAVIEALAVAVRSGWSQHDLLTEALGRARLPQRAFILASLGAVADGAESPLELRYLRDVERKHHLPRGLRQQPEVLGGIALRSDVTYERYALRCELDGQLGHPAGRTDADTWRDNLVVLGRAQITLRYRWSHVALTPCAVADQVANGLTRGGWRGTPQRCGPRCTLRQR